MGKLRERSVVYMILLGSAVIVAACGSPLSSHPASNARAAVHGTLVDAGLADAQHGWIVTSTNGLLVTTDSGATWHQRNPTAAPVTGAYLVSGGAGVAALVQRPASSSIGAPETAVFSTTADFGATWSSTAMVLAPSTTFSGAGAFALDSTHSWVLLHQASSSAFSSAYLYGSVDGGKSWSKTAAPFYGKLTFTTASRGWLAGGNRGDQFSTSADGGATWQRVALPGPSSTSLSHIDGPYVFGSLLVVLRVYPPNGESSGAVEPIASSDGGSTWRTLGKLTGPRDGAAAATAGDSNMVFAWFSDGLHVSRDGGQTWSTTTPVGLPDNSVVWMRFVGSSAGWAIRQAGVCSKQDVANCSQEENLYMTTDGGRDWTNISPG